MNVDRVKKGVRHPVLATRYLTKKARKNILEWMYDDSGVHILDREWDTLIILDCCRFDSFSQVSDLSGKLSKEKSVASVTHNFVKRNFSERTAHDVVYLSANPVVGKKDNYLDVHKLIGLWNEEQREKRGQENTKALTDPEPVVKKAIEAHKEFPNKRHIVHLLPPHVPHLYKDGEQLSRDSPYRNYEAVREGKVDAHTMIDVYHENINYVLESIKPLISDIEGKIVITGDHGELLGEGMPRKIKLLHTRWDNEWEKYDWGHYKNVDVSELRNVPWFEIPFESRRRIIPEQPVNYESDTKSIENQLEALGYR